MFSSYLFLSQYIPVVPRFINDHINLGGYTLNKFGFIFITYLLLYGIKCILSYLFLPALETQTVGSHILSTSINFSYYYFAILCPYIGSLFLSYRSLSGVQLLHRHADFYLCRQNSISTFNRNPTLPKEWYYKFLYICTLQILPHLVVWKFLFLVIIKIN